MIDAAMRSASSTKSSSMSCVCSDVGEEPDAEDAETPGDTDIDIFPGITDSALVGMVELMPHFLETNNHCLLFFQLLEDNECS